MLKPARMKSRGKGRPIEDLVDWTNGFFRSAGIPSNPEKGEQVGIEFVFVRVGEAVRTSWIDLQGGVFDELDRGASRGFDRHDLVIVAVDDEGWHVELLEVIGEVRLGKRLDAVELVLETSLHALQPERVANALADLSSRPVGAVECSS